MLYRDKGEYAKAEPLLKQVLDFREKNPGGRGSEYSRSLHSLAVLYRRQGEFTRAQPLLEKAVDVRKKTVGERHPLYARSVAELAQMYWSQGDLAKARPLLETALRVIDEHQEATAGSQSDRQQLRTAAVNRRFLDGYLSMTDGYAAALRWKGAVLLRQRQQRLGRDLLEEQSPDARKLYTDLQGVSRRLAALALADAAPGKADERNKELTALTDEKERLERELAGRSAAFRKQRETARLTPEQLRKSLPAGAALIDFLEYNHARPDPARKGQFLTEPRLLAFVVRPDRDVLRVNLGPTKAIAEAVEKWRLTLKRVRPVQGDADPPSRCAVSSGSRWRRHWRGPRLS